MQRILHLYCRLLEVVVAALLAIMVVLVFGNVVLRYLFNSGITVSEELSRWMFVWVTFLGAVVALHRSAHLGTDVLVGRLGPAGKKACLAVGHALMIFTSGVMLRGCWQQAVINADVTAPATGLPVAIVYVAGLVFAASALVILTVDLVRLLGGRMREDELVQVRDSEEAAAADDLVPPAMASHGR